MPGFGFLVRRGIAMIFVLIAITFITFLISHVIPGDPAQLMSGPRASAEQVAEMRASLGLDRPLLAQYALYLGDLTRGDLGTSIVTGRSVGAELIERVPATLELMALALVIAVAAGLALGIASAYWRGGIVDHAVRIGAIVGISTPSFWIGLMLLLAFYSYLDWLPAGGRLDPAHDFDGATGFHLLDALLSGRPDIFTGAFRHLLLPAITLAIAPASTYARLIRASLVDALCEDYVRTARAQGMRRLSVLTRYALPNSLLPFVTIVGVDLGHLLFGSVVIESVFAWPGLGSYVLEAIFELDFPVIMGFTVLTSAAFVAINLLVDLVYARLDPRVDLIG